MNIKIGQKKERGRKQLNQTIVYQFQQSIETYLKPFPKVLVTCLETRLKRTDIIYEHKIKLRVFHT